jgi:hypothetical protein
MTTATISGLVSQRLNEGAAVGGPQFYPGPEILAAVNEGQRLFALLTLCLERQSALAIPANTTFLHVLPVVADYLAPLRITDASGAKVRPATFGELWSLDAAWPAAIGPPIRYVAAGADLAAFYGRSGDPVTVQLQYAGSPALLVNGGDVPQIPTEYHQELINYGIYRVRQVEGGEEFAATLPLLDHYLQAAQDYGAFIKARNVGAGYDSLPFELAGFDRSRLVGKKKGK